MELCEYIKEQEGHDKRYPFGIQQGPREVKASIEKVSQTKKVVAIQNTEEKPGLKTRPQLNESTSQQTPKRWKGSAFKAEGIGETHVVATIVKGNGSLKKDMEALRKVAPRKIKDRRKIWPEVIIISKGGEE